jgi:stringent starvation protein B
MKSLKTRLVEATIDHLCEGNLKIHTNINWAVLDAAKGSIPVSRAEFPGSITINISPNAVDDFSIFNNTMHFNCRFKGESKSLIVPTCAINGIFDPMSKMGSAFDAHSDFLIEQQTEPEVAKVVKEVVQSTVKKEKKYGHLSVIK